MPDHHLIPFQFQTHTLSVITDDHGEPWWIASEVCEALELHNVSQAVSRLDADEKDAITISDALHSELKTLIINEAGLYRLTLSSRKKSAKEFRRWILHDVLPQIRKTGQYGQSTKALTTSEMFLAQATINIELEQRQFAIEGKQQEQGAQLQEHSIQLAALQAERPPVGKAHCTEWLNRTGKPFLPKDMLSIFRSFCKAREKPVPFRPASSQYPLHYYSESTLEAAYDEMMRQNVTLFPGQERRRG